jgi:hypothetical protein
MIDLGPGSQVRLMGRDADELAVASVLEAVK